MTSAADQQLAVALGQEAERHDAAAETARHDQAAVLLRLYESGSSYPQLMSLTGLAKSTVTERLARARKERLAMAEAAAAL